MPSEDIIFFHNIDSLSAHCATLETKITALEQNSADDGKFRLMQEEVWVWSTSELFCLRNANPDIVFWDGVSDTEARIVLYGCSISPNHSYRSKASTATFGSWSSRLCNTTHIQIGIVSIYHDVC